MSQPDLFYESYLDALKDDVKALGGAKRVGGWFKPEKDAEAARNWLNDCLNSERRERLDGEQERLIIRRAKDERGFSAALYFICDDTGFERPKAKSPDDEKAEALRTLADTTQVLRRALETVERLTQPPLATVRNAA